MKKIISILAFVMLLACLSVAVNAAVGKVVYATKVDQAPNMEEDSAFIDESWGKSVNHSSGKLTCYGFKNSWVFIFEFIIAWTILSEIVDVE